MTRYFNQITIQTPESVELEFTLAGIGNRALALLLIDYPLWVLLLVMVIYLGSLVSQQIVDLVVFLGGGTESIELWLAAMSLLLFFIIYVGYFVIFETLWQGQTPGKRVAKIRVIRENGQPAGLFQATLRSLLRPIDDILFIGFFLIVLTPKEKRLGDWMAGTLIVQTERPVVSKAPSISQAAEPIAEELLQIANLSLLQPDDLAVIREYLQRRTVMAPKARSKLSLQLARQAKTLIDLEHLPSDMTPDAFLEAVYLAYQRLGGSVQDRD
ncbi:MAG: RDD family protein [Pseudanabaenales cyanobacterium]|nr:RDD family protein [Pseudanabaenales cyanobacterium]